MAESAHVTSVEALEAFRASLVLYVSKARPTLEEVSAEALRTRLWLENDQRGHWEGMVRQRRKVVEQAQAALSSARMSNLGEASSAEQMLFHRAKRALEEAEAKLKLVKYWTREFENRAGPLVNQLQKLHTILAHDMVKAMAYLAELIKSLSDYADLAPATPAALPPSSELTVTSSETNDQTLSEPRNT
jgi:hypothetical protein